MNQFEKWYKVLEMYNFLKKLLYNLSMLLFLEKTVL